MYIYIEYMRIAYLTYLNGQLSQHYRWRSPQHSCHSQSFPQEIPYNCDQMIMSPMPFRDAQLRSLPHHSHRISENIQIGIWWAFENVWIVCFCDCFAHFWLLCKFTCNLILRWFKSICFWEYFVVWLIYCVSEYAF